MTIVGGFDVHRAQITFDYLDTDTGEVTRGEIRPASRNVLRTWLGRFAGCADVAFAVEGCTGWRFVVEELAAAGVRPHLAEPADTATQRGRKMRAKTDRADAHLARIHRFSCDHTAVPRRSVVGEQYDLELSEVDHARPAGAGAR